MKEQTLESLQTGSVITLTTQDSQILTWLVPGPHREEVLSLQDYLCSVAVIKWEMNFRRDRGFAPQNIMALLIPPLLLDSRGETEGVQWSSTGNKPFLMRTTYFEGNYCHYNHNLLIWDIIILNSGCLTGGWSSLTMKWVNDILGNRLSEVHNFPSEIIICHIRKGGPHFKQYVYISCLDISYLLLESL